MLVFVSILTALFYMLVFYLSYITAFILYDGLRYRLILSIYKSTIFIGVTYISIISDVLLFSGAMYSSIMMKNGLLLLLISSSLVQSVSERRQGNEHERE
ncbi:hypothetical protein CPT_Mater193 [Bacillus phage Mater]|uniref:Uncharacterized protein n=1 Tax=Bacillus phage Mater TaxID=1540090 RepID=A0A0A0RMQ6_9CAUD|nr:membrane protein [Bacillus phage Mater]AIW03350.1 hypothetical protein CPT_Mater193 [Bacillus phage Mater]